jgi:hypothetical protein
VKAFTWADNVARLVERTNVGKPLIAEQPRRFKLRLQRAPYRTERRLLTGPIGKRRVATTGDHHADTVEGWHVIEFLLGVSP